MTMWHEMKKKPNLNSVGDSMSTES